MKFKSEFTIYVKVYGKIQQKKKFIYMCKYEITSVLAIVNYQKNYLFINYKDYIS